MTGSGVLLVPHPRRPEAVALAELAARHLTDRGCPVHTRVADDDQALPEGLGLAVSLGGDGTMLRTIELAAPAGVPVLGVNVGHLGYLTAVEPADLPSALDRFLAGDHAVEERMMLCVDVHGPDGDTDGIVGRWLAMNEAVIERPHAGSTVHLALEVNGEFFTSYVADGLILATPTGSTAYNLSARGPIVSPRAQALIVTPVCPHMLFDRSLVLHGDEVVQVEVLGGRPAALVIDGRLLGTLPPGARVECRQGPHTARLVSFEPRDFHQIVKAKFGLADR